MGDSAAASSQGAAATPGIPAVEPATDASSDRRWRRFGEYGSEDEAARATLELLSAAESEKLLPLLEKQRRSALSKREEAALVDCRRHLRGLPSSGDIFRASFFVPGYQRGFPIGGKGCMGPCDHKFGQEGGAAGEHQVHIAVRMMRVSTRHSKSYSHMCPRHSCIVPGLEAFHVRESGRGVST